MSPGFEADMHRVAAKPLREQRRAVGNAAQPEHVGARRRGERIAAQWILEVHLPQRLSVEPLQEQWMVGVDADDRDAGRVGGVRSLQRNDPVGQGRAADQTRCRQHEQQLTCRSVTGRRPRRNLHLE